MTNKKIKNWKELEKEIEKLKKEGKKIVTTNGIFDIIHKGHTTYLRKAKKLGNILVVAINSDDSTKRLKGENKPINKEKDRAEVISALESVDYVTIFPENDPRKVLSVIKPHIHVKGGDYTRNMIETSVVEANGGRIKILNLTKGFSTTNIIKKLKENF